MIAWRELVMEGFSDRKRLSGEISDFTKVVKF